MAECCIHNYCEKVNCPIRRFNAFLRKLILYFEIFISGVDGEKEVSQDSNIRLCTLCTDYMFRKLDSRTVYLTLKTAFYCVCKLYKAKTKQYAIHIFLAPCCTSQTCHSPNFYQLMASLHRRGSFFGTKKGKFQSRGHYSPVG